MVPPSSVAAALAVLPADGAEPRVIQQFTSVFLVSRYGELWRVYDSASPDGSERRMPSASSKLPYRLFIALARKFDVRAYAFSANESPDIDPDSLQRQLDLT
ncbi:MAG TPA: hypothetical protein VN706_06385 [Gemmatimonadaceae bacterium]|nr:hypothetical protein [Gemmatimonadaceae bacterium]